MSPVKHVLRTAAEHYELRGRQIRPGDALMLCFPSANRDEEIFSMTRSRSVSAGRKQGTWRSVMARISVSANISQLWKCAYFSRFCSIA